MSDDKLPPLIMYPGGKSKISDLIIRHFPKHDTYVEPFAGGAAVFFRKPSVKKSVLSDKDPWSIELFDDVRHGKTKKCRGGILASRSLFERSKRSRKDPCMKLALSALSYHGNRVSYRTSSNEGRVLGRNKMRRIKKYESKLRKAHLMVGDFAKAMRKHDSVKALHFLDPPWPLDSNYSDQMYNLGRKGKMGKAYDPEHVVDVCAKMKGASFIIYGDHPSVRKAFRRAKKLGFKIYAQPVRTNIGKKGDSTKVNLIAIRKARKGKKK